MLPRNEMIAYLDYAATRLQNLANSSRGTVCDDDKVWALEMEIAAIRSARQIIANTNPPQQMDFSLGSKIAGAGKR